MKVEMIKETCIYTEDLDGAKEFYCDILGLPLIAYLPDKHLFIKAGTSVLLVFNPNDSRLKVSPPPHYAAGKQHFAFEVKETDYEATKAELKLKGITITDEVTWKSGKKSFYFNDPTGNVLEVIPEKGLWD